MSQRSITSFFKKVPTTDTYTKKKEDDSGHEAKQSDVLLETEVFDSPIKSNGKRKRTRKIESGSEEDDLPHTDKKEKKELSGKNLLHDNSTNESEAFERVEKAMFGKPVHKTLKSAKTSGTPKIKFSPGDQIAAKVNSEAAKEVQKKSLISKSKTGAFDVSEEVENAEIGRLRIPVEKDEENKNVFPAKKEMKKMHISLKPDTSEDKFNSEETDYNPARSNYHPINHAYWNKDAKVPYMALAITLAKIEEVSSRLKIVEILSNYFRSVIVLSPQDLLPSVYLCLNQLAPAYEGLELGIAEGILMKAIAQTTGRSTTQIKADAKELGDLGLVAEQSKCSQRMMFTPAAHTVSSVYGKLKEIARMTGHAAVAKKVDKIQSMFVACKGPEARYLIRGLAGKLRIGLAEQSVLQALAQACTQTPPNQEYPPKVLNVADGISAEKYKQMVEKNAMILKTSYCECPNYDRIVPVIIEYGIKTLPDHCQLTPGLPLKPMLAHPTRGVQEVINRFDGIKFTCEWKYDGERAQIHMTDEGKVSIYSRNQEDNTSKYPDIISRLEACMYDTVKSFILDSECVAWDVETQKIKPFQILSTRKRKDANESEIKVQVCVFMFDLLYLNGEPLVKEPLSKRRTLLKKHFREVPGQWLFAHNLDTNKMEEVQDFLEESVKGNCEGLMVKTLENEATYEIAKRSRNWLKLKKDYMDSVGDSIDVVVIGGYLGKGKRTGLYGGFLLACYDPANEEYQSLCKIGTGFSDEDFQKHTEFFKSHLIEEPRSYYRYDKSHLPDCWFDAVQVWEIKCADLSLSPVHRAAIGIVDPERGISLRFPRFLRVRDDKAVEQATSAQQIAEMYENQDQIKNQEADLKVNEEDFY